MYVFIDVHVKCCIFLIFDSIIILPMVSNDNSYLFFQNSDSRVYSSGIYFFMKTFDNVPYGHGFKSPGNFDYFKENKNLKLENI